MTAFVVDASVAVKWYVDEPGAAPALAYLGLDLRAPDVVLAEVASALTRRVRRNIMTAEQATLAARQVPKSYAALTPVADLVDRAVELSLELRHATYDCFYVALAERERLPLVTDDGPLAKKAAHKVQVIALRPPSPTPQ